METPSFETTTQVFVGNHSMNIHIMSRLNIPPREPRDIEIGPSFSAKGYNPPKKSQLGV
jgi:hypothetical protein